MAPVANIHGKNKTLINLPHSPTLPNQSTHSVKHFELTVTGRSYLLVGRHRLYKEISSPLLSLFSSLPSGNSYSEIGE